MRDPVARPLPCGEPKAWRARCPLLDRDKMLELGPPTSFRLGALGGAALLLGCGYLAKDALFAIPR